MSVCSYKRLEDWRVFAENRREAWTEGRPVAPPDGCPRFVLQGPADPCAPSNLADVRAALAKIDAHFELLFDRFSTLQGPSYHLYTRQPGWAGGGWDRMIYEFSCQEHPGRPWPDGRPLMPGMWFVEVVRRAYKPNRFVGGEQAIQSQVMAEHVERENQTAIRMNRETNERVEWVDRDVMQPYYVRARITSSGVRDNRLRKGGASTRTHGVGVSGSGNKRRAKAPAIA